MDTFVEQIVRKKKDAKEWLIIIGVLLAAVLLAAVLWVYLGSLGALLIVAAGYGAWWLITSQNKEYEYCVTEGDIDIDLITAKRKRKRVVAVSGGKIEKLLPYTADVSLHGYQRVLVAAPSAKEAGLWYFTYHSKKNGHTLIVFQPTERVLRALCGGLQNLQQLETKRAAAALGITL